MQLGRNGRILGLKARLPHQDEQNINHVRIACNKIDAATYPEGIQIQLAFELAMTTNQMFAAIAVCKLANRLNTGPNFLFRNTLTYCIAAD